jgi:1,6-anhydro-N-acetylmuramate kinase
VADLPLEQVHAKCANEWVALEVTRSASTGAISHGRIIHHSPARAAISRAVQHFWRAKPKGHVYIFLAGAMRTTHEERRASLRGQAFQKYISASW